MSSNRPPFDRPIANPYPGLRPFEPHEAAIFFGRDEHVADMLTVLENHRFLAVVGPSGGGKSSLVLAGLLPALRRGELLTDRSGDWRFVTMRPGDSPFRNLAEAVQASLTTATDAVAREASRFHDGDSRLTEIVLRGGEQGFTRTLRDAAVPATTNVLLLVDQFEELFRFREPERAESDEAAARRRDEAADFVKLLLATARQSARPVYVMLTMRSDFLGDCDTFEGLPQAINAGQYLTPRLDLRQLERAISGPPSLPQFGGSVEPTVIQRIANDVGSQRDELPVVQHALSLAWRHATERTRTKSEADPSAPVRLKLADYLAVGGIREALSRDADEALQACRESGLERTTELVFRALVQRGQNGQFVRRPRTMGQLVAETGESFERVVAVVERFFRDRSFLIPAPREIETWTPDTRVDISHESLIRQWGTLRNRWLATEREAESRLRRLADAERKFRHGDGDLLPEIEMKRLDEWWRRTQPNRAWAARYLTPYVGPRAENAFDAVEKFLIASRQAYEDQVAEEKRRIEEKQARQIRELEDAEKRLRMIRGWLAGVITLALIAVGVGYYANQKRAEAERFERSARKATREAYRNLADARWSQAVRARDDDRNTIAATWGFSRAAAASGAAHLASRQTAERIAANGTRDLVASFVHSRPDGARGVGVHFGAARLLTWSDGTIRFWDVQTGRYLKTWHHKLVAGATLSTSEKQVLTWGWDRKVRLWNESLDAPIREWSHESAVRGAILSPAADRALTWTDDGVLRLWNIAQQQPVRTWKHEDAVASAQFSPDLSLVVSTTKRDVTLFDVTSDRPIRSWRNGVTKARGLEFVHAIFDGRGTRLLTWGSDGVVRLIEPRQATPLREWSHGGFVWWARFHGDDKQLVSVADGGTVNVLSELQDDPVAKVECGKSSSHHTVSHNLSWLLVSNDQLLELWDIKQVKVVRRWFHPGFRDARFSHDDSQVLTWGFEGTLKLWTVSADEPVQDWQHDKEVRGAAFNRDGTRVLSWSDDGTARMWSVEQHAPVRTWKHCESGAELDWAEFRDDETQVLTWSNNGIARVWAIELDAADHVLKHGGKVEKPVFSRDSARLLVASADKSARLWDVRKAQELRHWTHDDIVVGATYLQDDSRVITWSLDGSACLRERDTGELLMRWEHDKPNKGITGVRLNADQSRVATWSWDERLQLWDVASESALAKWHDAGDILDATFLRQSSRLLTWDRAGRMRLWSAESPRPIREYQPNDSRHAEASGVTLNHKETLILAWHRNGDVVVWDSDRTDPKHSWWLQYCQGARFVDGDRKIISWGSDMVVLASVDSGKIERKWDFRGLRNLAWNEDHSMFVTCEQDGGVALWSMTQKHALRKWNHPKVTSVQFGRTGEVILSWGKDGRVRAWNASNPLPLRTWKYGEASEYLDGGVLTSNRDEFVLTWTADGAVRLFDLDHEEPLREFAKVPTILGAMFSPDGERIVAWGDSGNVHIWDLRRRDVGMREDGGLDWTVRSATTLDAAGRIVDLTFDQWHEKLESLRSRKRDPRTLAEELPIAR